MIIKFLAKNVSETRAFSNPTQGTQCGVKTNSTKNSVSERRDLYSDKILSGQITINL